jgi:putative hemolysin
MEGFKVNPILLSFSGFFVVLTAFFTTSETALISCDRLFLKRRKAEGSKAATLALRLVEDTDRLVSTTQFGANLSIAAATTIATVASAQSPQQDEWIVIVLLAPVLLVFSDSLPKVLARAYSKELSLYLSLPLSLFARACSPLLFLIGKYTERLTLLLGIDKQDSLSRRKKVREEISALFGDTDAPTDIRFSQQRIIKRVLDFSQKTVKKVMLPLVKVDALSLDTSIEESVILFEKLRHSRLPVYGERIDNIVGVLYFADLFACADLELASVEKLMRTALFVPESQQLDTLVKELQSSEIAVVVDEYGGAVGIVTKEDVLEEIVGDISDEWDEAQLGIHEIGSGNYLVHGTTSISEVNERLGIQVPKGEYETLSGFLLQQFNRIPAEGDELYFANFLVRVHRASPKSIQTVIIEVMEKGNI